MSKLNAGKPVTGTTVNLTPAEQILLKLLGRDEHPVTDILSTYTESDWTALIEVGREQRLLTLLYSILKRRAVVDLLPPEIRQTLKNQYKQNSIRNFQLYHAFFTLQESLAAAEIPCIPLKGIYLAAAVYDNIGDRVCGDMDLLVPESALPSTVTVAEGCGYELVRPIIWEPLLQKKYHLPPMVKQQEKIVVEWHWHIAAPEKRGQLSIDEFWSRARDNSLLSQPVTVLSLEDQLCHLAFHLSYSHEFSFGLRSLCDIDQVCRRYGNQIDWTAVHTRARRWGWQRGLYLAFALAAQQLDTPIPQKFLADLRPREFDPHLLAISLKQLFVSPDVFISEVPPAWTEMGATGDWRWKANRFFGIIFPSTEKMNLRHGLDVQTIPRWRVLLYRWRYLLQKAVHMLRRRRGRGIALAPLVQRRSTLSAWLAERE